MIAVTYGQFYLEVYLIVFFLILPHEEFYVLGNENFAQVGGYHQAVEGFWHRLPSLEVNLCYFIDSIFYFDDEFMFFFIYSQNLCSYILVVVHKLIVLICAAKIQ